MKIMGENVMGDRTFSAEDVIRIYENFLTSAEMQTVDEFFEPAEDLSLIPFVAVQNLLDVLVPLFDILRSFPIALVAALFAPARIALAFVIPIMAGIIRILRVILATEGI